MGASGGTGCGVNCGVGALASEGAAGVCVVEPADGLGIRFAFGAVFVEVAGGGKAGAGSVAIGLELVLAEDVGVDDD